MDRQRVTIALLVFAVFMPYRHVMGQELAIRGRFLVDSIKVGSIFPYSLSVHHAEDVDVLFPDSTYSFVPFEFDHKLFFPTQTRDGLSYDSVVYFLSSFEIDSVQKLGLPIFVIHDADCTAVYAKEDSVSLTFLIDHVPDSVSARELPLKTNTTYRVVNYLLNYPFFIALGVGLVVILLIVWIFLRHRIRRYFLLRKLNRRHALFMSRFDNLAEQIKAHYARDNVEAMLVVWKQHLESLLGKPFTKYTSKEIFDLVSDRQLYGVLQKIDRSIHGNELHGTIEDDIFLSLKYFVEDSFDKKIAEIKNA